MEKHTPEPWTVMCDEQGYLVMATTEMRKQLPICEVSRGCFSLSAEANARLIAAAPDLLDMLKAITNGMVAAKEDGRGYRLREPEKWLNRIQKTIAKAEGK